MPAKTKGMTAIKGFMSAMALVAVVIIGTVTSLSAGTGPVVGGNWRLMVKSAACVKGPTVFLGEIAYPVEGVDERTWQTLASVKLWTASKRRGSPVIVDQEKLAKVLKHYMGDMVGNLILPQQMAVQTGGYVLTHDELRHEVVAFLTPRAEDFGGEVQIKNLQIPMHFFFDNETDELKLELASSLRPGRNQIRMKAVSPEGKTLYSKAGTAFLNIWKTVAVAAQPLNRYERVTPDKVAFKRVNLAYKPDVWDGKGGPWRMTRTLGRGQAFTSQHLEAVPLIEKGERVNLVFEKKRIRLSIKAEALGEAELGQQVSVRNLQSNKKILATAVSDDTVIVR